MLTRDGDPLWVEMIPRQTTTQTRGRLVGGVTDCSAALLAMVPQGYVKITRTSRAWSDGAAKGTAVAHPVSKTVVCETSDLFGDGAPVLSPAYRVNNPGSNLDPSVSPSACYKV